MKLRNLLKIAWAIRQIRWICQIRQICSIRRIRQIRRVRQVRRIRRIRVHILRIRVLKIAMKYSITENMKYQWIKMDGTKLKNRQRKNSNKYKVRRKKLKWRKVKTVNAFIHGEGVHYKSGSFHQGKQINFFHKCKNLLVSMSVQLARWST